MLEMFKGGPRSFNIFILILFSSCYCYISTSVWNTMQQAHQIYIKNGDTFRV